MKTATAPSVQYSDAQIVESILSGKRELFEMLIRRYNAVLYKTGRAYNYSHEDTQDLMQDTFLDAFASLAQFEGRAAFKTWITRIMLNNCYRRRQKFSFKNEMANELDDQSIPLFTSDHLNDTGKVVVNQELRLVIERALLQLPLDYRIVFTLREVNGMNVEETGEALNLTESNVKVRLNRAKAMLRSEIENSYTAQDIFEFNRVYCDAMVIRVMSKLDVD